MASALGWVSFGSAEAEAVDTLMGALTDSEARDELGIGAIRDGFSDLLFPGTSTVQTRLRYFLMIPRLFDSMTFRTSDHRAELRTKEAELIDRIQKLPAGADRDLLIGVEAGANLKRMPSAIYWAGLGAWGIRLNDRAGIGDVLDGMAEGKSCWNNPPATPADDALGFTLTEEEAEWIRDRCAALRAGQTLLGTLMSNAKAAAKFDDLADAAKLDLPPRLREQLDHALAFSETMHGAALLYNLMLAEKFDESAVDGWQHDLEAWQAKEIEPAKDARTLIAPLLEAAEDVRFSLKEPTRNFVNAWLGVMDDPTGKAARDLIMTREAQAKPGRARLQMKSGDYRWSGSSGASRLTYRWARVQRYLQDITQAVPA